MTSLSRKNRRTTLRRTIRKATAISLAWLGLAGTASAQAPAATLTKPNVTNWSNYPATPIAQTPTKPVEVSVPPASAIGTRVLMTGQNGNAIIPVQTVVPPIPPTRGLATQDEINVFRLSNDEELNNRMLKELNAEYLKRWEKDKAENEKKGLPVPIQPKPRTLAELPESSGIPRAMTGVQSRQDPTPLWLKVEPSFVVHRRLMFEDKNAERYGWDAGFAQPFLSAGYFAKDLVLWPSNLASNLFERYDTSAGKCPPGSPVPYLLYPPEITVFGGTVGAAVIVGTAFLIP